LFFRFAAKLSLYQPQVPPVRTLSSSKLWQSGKQQTKAAAVELKKSSTPLLVIIALQLLAASLPVHEWLKRELFVPVQLRNISSKSQLRAHPSARPP
jgi:hypothetical protein